MPKQRQDAQTAAPDTPEPTPAEVLLHELAGAAAAVLAAESSGAYVRAIKTLRDVLGKVPKP